MKNIFLLILVIILFSAKVFAEGTYELNNKDASNPNVYIESMPAGNNVGSLEVGLRRITMFHVDILNSNEKIDIYTSANQGSVDVAIWCESNTPTNFANDYQNAQKTYNVSQDGIGHISSWSDVVNAQSLSTRNKTPITFDPDTEGCGNGTYAVRVYGVGNSSTNDAVRFIDIMVRKEDVTTEIRDDLNGFWGRYCPTINYQHSKCVRTTIDQELKRGRVWSYHYSLILGAFDREMYSKYYVVAGQSILDYYSGYLWEVTNTGMQPHGFHVTANALGPYPQNNHNKSVPISVNPTMIAEYPIYLNYPEKAVVDPMLSPSITNMQFTANCNNNNPQGGVFSFNATDEWNYAFYIDVNGDGEFFEDEAIIRGKTVNGQNLISWDGKFENGQDVPTDRKLILNLNLAAGEIHFPYYDVENRYTKTGPIIKLVNIPETNRSKNYFWDDTDIGGDSSSYLGSLTPHRWENDIGNEAIVDTWKNAVNTNYNLEFVYGQACSAKTKIRAQVFEDDNHDGRYNSNENIGSLNIKLDLYNHNNGTCETITSDGNGYFEELVDYGNYTLTVNSTNSACSQIATPPPFYISTTPTQYNFNLTGISDLKLFGFFNGKTIEGEILNDNGQGGGESGITAGIANNANRETYEKGIHGVNVQAFNGAALITENYTDIDGYFKLWIPSGQNNIKIMYKQPYGYISVNSHIGNSASVSYTYDEINLNMQNYGNVRDLVFSDVKSAIWNGSISVYGQSGSSVFINNTLKTHSYTVNKYYIENKSVTNSEWNVVLYHDDECNGALENWNEVIEPNVGNTTHDFNNINKSCIISKVFIPLGAQEGDEFTFDLCAEITYHNTVVKENICFTNKVGVVESTANVNLLKSADKTTAKPGEEITYTIKLKNIGLEPASNLKVYDATPPYTSFISASCQNNTGSNITNCIYITNMVNLEGDIEWNLTGYLNPNEEYILTYKVKIND